MMAPTNHVVIFSCIFIFICVQSSVSISVDELPSGIIQLDTMVSARNLPNMDPLLLPADHPADPQAFVFYGSHGAYDVTEILKNDPNPQWTKIFSFEYDLDNEDANATIGVTVWDQDYGLASEVIGSISGIYVKDLIESPEQSIETQLKTDSPNESWVTIKVVGINGTRISHE